jgi:hypothetical protein
MNGLDFLKSLNDITDKINKSIYPLGTNQWLNKINTGFDFNELKKAILFNNKSLNNELFELSKSTNWNYDFNKTIISQLNSNIGVSLNNDIFEKINSASYWGNIAKLSLINGVNIFDDDEISVSDVITDNFDDINHAIEQIEKNPIEFFNNIVVSIKTYMDNNPAIKYSAHLVGFIISIYITVLITNSLSNPNDNKPEVHQISYTINNNSTKDLILKINCKSISLKNFPRDNSKSVHNLSKNDKVKILKDSLKWAFVIKENSVETGWIRKEYLNFSK